MISSSFPNCLLSGVIIVTATTVTPLFADWRTDVGYDRLVQIAGSDLPDAPAEGLSQIEAFAAEVNYSPNQTLARFSERTFVEQSGTTGVSNHATSVATNYYSSTNGILTGNASVDLYSADGWLTSGFLNALTTLEPRSETNAVQNHSWVGSLDDDAVTEDVMRRLDYAINRDGFSCAVGVNNGANSNLPELLAHSYHTISVGLSSGGHSSGLTTADGVGRSKPDMVAPSTATSFATPMVSASAALLHVALGEAPHSLSGPERVRTIKALLMASARKDTVLDSGAFTWSNSPTSPLDANSGAGELNVFLAYKILSAGAVSSSDTALNGTHGWASEAVSSSAPRPYFFTIPAGSVSPPVSALLTWHRVIANGNRGRSWGNPTSSFADLTLKLHAADGTILGSELNRSNSAVDNVELIHETALPPGDYAWVVESSASVSTPYALAWQTIPVVTIAATDSTASEVDSSGGEFTITRSDDTSLPLLVSLSFSGSSVEDLDYTSISSEVMIPAGESSVTIEVLPLSNNTPQGDRTLIVQLASDFTYSMDATEVAEIVIEDKPFDKFLFENFDFTELANAEISSLNADPDGDSLSNLLEFAIGSDPLGHSSGPTYRIDGDGRIVLITAKNPAATDVILSAEDSEDLQIWNTSEIITNSGSLFEARDTSETPGEGRRFIRLRVTRP